MEEDRVVYFRETQRFQQRWVWVLILAPIIVVWYSFVHQVILGKPFGNRPAPDVVLVIVWLLVGIGLPWLFHSARLVTEVCADGIYIRFYPFHFSFQKIDYRDIKRIEACTYRPIVQYGGWGIRYGKGGKAYNVSGNRGVRLEFHKGKHLLIGSLKPDELCRAIRQFLPEG